MTATSQFLVCVANDGAEDLQILKVYRALADEAAERHEMVRVIDDSGEDYLYPRLLFVPLPLTPALEERLEDLASVPRSDR
jgi:hypothetical protein